MAEINLGNIKFNWKGAYGGGTAYVVDDVVESGGSSYVCILASTGNTPPNGTYWNLMAEAGTDTSVLTTQGDVLYRDASGLQRLAAGTSGQVLQTGGSGANPSWTDAGSGHLVAFYNHVNAGNDQTTSSTFVVSGSTITFTPASSSSRFFILCTFQSGNDTASRRSSYQIFRNGSGLSNSDMQQELTGANSNENPAAMSVYDSPSTASAITYDIRFKCNVNGGDTAKIQFKNLSIFEFAS